MQPVLGCDGPPRTRGPNVKSIRSNILAFAILATLIPSVGLGLMSFVGYQDVINRNVDYELRALAKDAAPSSRVGPRARARPAHAVDRVDPGRGP